MDSKKVCFLRGLFWLTCLALFFFSVNTLQAQKIRNVGFEKQNLTAAERKVSSAIRQVVVKMQEQRITLNSTASSFSNSLVKIDNLANIQTYIHLREFKPQFLGELRALGATLEVINEDWKMIQAWIPYDKVYDFAERDFVKFIRPPGYRITKTGSVNSEGDAILRADDVRSMLGFDGTGTKVGVISDGVTSLAASQSTDDLPATVEIDPTRPGSGDEGTAMLEIVHDLAPGAQLAFSGPTTSLEMAQSMNFLANDAFGGTGSDIVVDDLEFPDQPMFEDGFLGQTADNIVANGVPYFTSAGNEATMNYENDYVTGSAVGTGFAHDFGVAAGGAPDEGLTVAMAEGGTLQAIL